MRIIRIVSILLIMFAIIFPQMASASEISTDTNINNTLLYFSNLVSPEIAQADGGQNIFSQQDLQPQKQIDSRTEAILSQWKDKQADKWKNLPSNQFTINASAYTASSDECGKSDGITASGVVAQTQRTIACPQEFPFGAKIKIADLGTFVCEDRGGAIKGNKVDIYMKTKKEAFEFGRQNLIAQVVE